MCDISFTFLVKILVWWLGIMTAQSRARSNIGWIDRSRHFSWSDVRTVLDQLRVDERALLYMITMR